MSYDDHCCHDLFPGFEFQNIRRATPPDEKGVYFIRVKARGQSIDVIKSHVEQAMHILDWSIVGNKVLGRVRRLENIGNCSTIYIGSAGTRQQSKHTLRGRHSDFAGRHTAMFPVWSLLYFGWELEYGWRIEARPDIAEADLKMVYKQNHLGKLPALVQR